MNWNPFTWFQHKPKKCDHVYFPVMMDGKPIGQECAICHKFNSVEEVLGSTRGDHNERPSNAKQR